jgi:hypothetical protein
MTATQAQHRVGGCYTGGPASRRLARRLSGAAASILPGAALVLLPKCPLCLAAWLTVVTGVGFSAASAAWLRGMLVVFSVAAVMLAAASVVRRALSDRQRLVEPFTSGFLLCAIDLGR